ncbi:MAG: hypothetical protein OQK82_08825 [Candidatus Pacearchaeota archaeon]|nr:hypothetical protein [Candidatus Pacearchaeota archaeon]
MEFWNFVLRNKMKSRNVHPYTALGRFVRRYDAKLKPLFDNIDEISRAEIVREAIMMFNSHEYIDGKLQNEEVKDLYDTIMTHMFYLKNFGIESFLEKTTDTGLCIDRRVSELDILLSNNANYIKGKEVVMQ